MKLNQEGIAQRTAWERAGYLLPEYDRQAVRKATEEKPFWIHFGAGNLFRAFQANVVQKLLNDGTLARGLIVAEGYDYEIIEKINRPHDGYSILVTYQSDGGIEKTVVGSVVESLALNSECEKDFDRLKEIFRQSSLQMATFTITEKGYGLTDGRGETLADVAHDFQHGPARPKSYIGKVASLLYERYKAGKLPIAMVSMDNCSHNGDRLCEAVGAFAEKWSANKTAEVGFLEYVREKERVSFPWTMIDKITPRPDAATGELLEKDGVEGMEPVVTSKNTYAAPFVNAEECEYLVIEDAFPNGRPALEKGGLMFADRETVRKAEKMKVCTCLNPLHTTLAIFGCLLGYTLISEEMKDKSIRKLVEEIGYREGLPVSADPKIIDPKAFLDTVIQKRIPNPYMPDAPQRIATDTSQKLAVRFGETIRAYAASDHLRVQDLRYIPLVFAGWLRYLMGVDDCGEPFSLSPDPLLETVRPYVSNMKFGDRADREALRPVLSNQRIFGVDLYEVGLSDVVCRYFTELCAGPGAVKTVLDRL